MKVCQSILGFLRQGNCICKERKNYSDAGMDLVDTEMCGERDGDLNLMTAPSPEIFAKGENETMIGKELESKEFNLYEEEIRVLLDAIENGRNEELESRVQGNDLETFVDAEGFSLLHKAVCAGNFKAVSILAQRINLNLTDDSGRTPLHYACLQQRAEIIDYLIEAGSNLDISDNYGKSPIEYFDNPTVLRSFSDILSRKSPNSLFSIVETTDETVNLLLKDMPKRKKTQKYLIKDYEVIKNIGNGSFSKVFLVRNVEDKKFYAMKVMNKEQICEKGMLGYVLTEKMILTKLKHPFIVPLLASFQINTHLMLLLHYCPDSLKDKLNKKLQKRLLKLYTCELALTLGYLHTNSIIYRDLKPSNILINEDGHIMLADFGLAKESSTLQTASFCGSIGYLAPEMESNKPYGKEVDWYMLGLVVFEMAVGSPFFEKPEKIEKTSGGLRDLLEKLLEKDPVRRLGAQGDFEEVKQHPFFQGVCWDRVYRKQTNLLERFSLNTADFTKSEKIMSLSFVDD